MIIKNFCEKGMLLWQKRNTSETISRPSASTAISEQELRTAVRFFVKKEVLSTAIPHALNIFILP